MSAYTLFLEMQFDIQIQKKNRVDLSEYPYEQDLNYRLLLASLNPTTTKLLIELFYLSSKTTLVKLKNALDLTENELKEFVDEIAPFNILSIEQDVVLIDKDVKKKIESFLEKFDEEFSHGIEYFQSLLKQVPINILPTWYSLPRSCDSIFLSLKEKIFHTPSQYLRHLQNIESDDPSVPLVIQALLAANNHLLTMDQLESVSGKSGFELQKLVLFLEFNFAAVMCYIEESGAWTSVLKLPNELSCYLNQLSVTPPFKILAQNLVKPDRGIPLTFAFDLSQVLRLAKVHTLKGQTTQEGIIFDPSGIQKLEQNLACEQNYALRLLKKAIELKLLEMDQGFITPHVQSEQWLLYSLEKQALSLYKAIWIQGSHGAKQVEKGLQTLLQKGWVLADEVIQYVSYGKPLLQRTRDGYSYDLMDQVSMTREHLDLLFESGLIEWGSIDKKRCVRLTELGKQITS